MGKRKPDSLERVLGRLDNLDAVNLTNLVQRLARERALLEAVFNAVREGILIIDENGLIEYANEAASRMIGIPEGDAGEVSLWKVLPDLARTLRPDPEGRRRPPPAFLKEFALSYPEPRYVRLYMVPFREDHFDKRQNRHAVILTDITRDKETAEEWVESERVASILLLAAGVAHEIGNPLNSITIHLQLMGRQLAKMETTPETARIRKSLDVCSDEVERLHGIITHFLQAVRPAPPDLREVNLLEILEEVLNFQKTELDNRKIRVDVEINKNLPMVLGDRDQLKQVFFNLVKNSMEAMKMEGRLKVRTNSDDDFVYLQIGDSGEGISREEVSRVFDAYYTTKKGGHGLGLMIVERIMRNHGGQVSIESEPGFGTIVSLQFPHKDRRVRLLKN